ncbi:DNA cytosine methyltransferase [Ancylobacter sp. IITR112]|uniref:DNA cytosine methyltransferase n=1 Tax=Ancylobacter sp. IITR112 TaxID=3138073 RepID=UPI00352B6971
MTFPLVTVCSGIGAAELGFAPHGIEAVLASEIEPFPRAVLEHRFRAQDARGRRTGPGPALWGDFTALRVRHLRRLGIALPRVAAGGTPCQSFSVAGKRGSLSDPRGNLSLSFVRLAHALANALAGRQRATYDDGPVFLAVWENVPGVLSTRDNAFGCFLAALVGGDAALEPPGAVWGPCPVFDRRSHDVGFAFGWQSCRWPREGMVEGPLARAAWRVLDAQHFGVPQRRERVFVVIGFGAGADPAEVLLEWESLRRDPAAGERAGEDPAGTLGGGARSRGGYSTDDIPLVGEAYGGGNTTGAIDVAACLTAKGQRVDFEVETFIAHTLRGEGFDASEDGTGRGTPLVPVAWGIDSDCIDRSGEGADGRAASRSGLGIVEEMAPALRAKRPGAVAYDAIAFNARQDTDVYGDVAGTLDVGSPQAQAIAFDTTQITSRANRSHPQPGDPCHPLAAGAHPPAIAFSSKDHGADAGEIAPTLRAMNHAGSHANAGGQVAIAFQQSQSVFRQNTTHATLDAKMGSRRMNGVMGSFGVRRLTPRECERLQDLPDDHTLIPWRGRPAEECPDGPRYRACGNAMNRRVMDWIGRRLAAQLRGEAV